MAKTQQDQSLAVRGSQEIAQLDELEGYILDRSKKADQPIAEDPERISREIVQRLLEAASDAELFTSQQATGWRTLLGLPVELGGFRWRPSTLEEGSNIFFVVFGKRMDNGEPVVLTTGASGVLAQLVNMAKRGTLVGAVVRMEESAKPTQSGFRPLRLELVAAAPATDAA